MLKYQTSLKTLKNIPYLASLFTQPIKDWVWIDTVWIDMAWICKISFFAVSSLFENMVEYSILNKYE
jgi:hypothetical protein